MILTTCPKRLIIIGAGFASINLAKLLRGVPIDGTAIAVAGIAHLGKMSYGVD